MANSFVNWLYADRITSAKLKNMSTSGVPRFGTLAELNASYPSPAVNARAWVDSVETFTGSALFEASGFLYRNAKWIPFGRPFLHVYRTAAGSWATGSYTAAQFSAKQFDPIGTYDAVTNYTFVAPATGVYRLKAQWYFNTNGTGIRQFQVYNQTTTINVGIGATTVTPGNAVTFAVNNYGIDATLVAGQVYQFRVFQNSGAALAGVYTFPDYVSWATVELIS